MRDKTGNRMTIHAARRGFAATTASGLLGMILLWACHLGPEDSRDTFSVVGDPAWTECHRVRVVLFDESGAAVDTLFDDSLASVGQLEGLDASRYDGGKGSLSIRGFLADGGPCFEETRSFDAGGTEVQVTPILDPGLSPESLGVEPKTLVLFLASPAAALRATPFPSHANPAVTWSVDSSGVVALEGLEDGKGNPARVKPLKTGRARVTARSLKDPSRTATVEVLVTDPGAGSIKIGKDTVRLFVKGPAESLTVAIPSEYAGQKVEWKVADEDIATVDARGRIQAVQEGETQVRATLSPSGLSDVALVQVRRDIPKLRVEAPKGAPVGGEIRFRAIATQRFGTLVSFRWDLLGDGAWDDSSAAGWSGDSVDLPEVRQRYDREGTFLARFQVMDSEGNTGEATWPVDIGNQAPEITFLREDTVISIKDSIPMEAAAKDAEGKVVWAGWDYEGDGRFDDTLTGDKAELRAALGHRYRETGTYLAVFRAVDDKGKAGQDTARIRVELDPPVADAGPDLTVTAGAEFAFSAKGTDGFGPIARREIKLGNGPFLSLSKQDTVLTAPSQPGAFPLLVRVTDDDGLSDVDTATLTVVLSSNADLSGLALSAGNLVPAFQPNSLNYAAQVSFGDSLVTVTPTVKVASTQIIVNAVAVASGAASEPVKLNLGANPAAFHIIVTAADGSQREYKVSINRQPNSEATLAKLEAQGLLLSPAFSPSVLEYADTVLQTVSSVVFKPTVASAGASLAFGDSAMTSGTFTAPQPLRFGENVFTFAITAQDGKSRTVYRVRVLRLGRLIAFRKMGSAAPVAVDTLDLPVDGNAPLSGGSYAGWKFLKWSVTEGSATLADSAANPTSVTLKSGFARVQADFAMLRYTVDLDASGCGKVVPGVDSTYDHGASPEYVLTPAAGCRIQSVTLDGLDEPSAYDGVYTFVSLAASHTLSVRFARAYVVDWKVTGRGTVTPMTATVDSGASATFKLRPDAGFKVAAQGVCSPSGCFNPRPDSTVVVDTVRAARTLTATFVRGYKVTASASPGAAVIAPLDSLADSASTVVWRFTLSPGYRLDTLLVNGTPSTPGGGGVTYTVAGLSRDTHVKLVTRRQYTLTVTYDAARGSVNQASRLVDSGTTLAFIATPDTGESTLLPNTRVDTVLVNGARPATTGTDAWSQRSWTVANIAANTTVRVTFRTFYRYTATNGPGYTVTPNLANVDSGQAQSFTFTPLTGYRFQEVILYRGSVAQYMSGNVLALPPLTYGGPIQGIYSNLYDVTLKVAIPTKGLLIPSVCISSPSVAKTCTVSPEDSLQVQIPYGEAYVIAAPPTSSTGSRLNPMHYFQRWEYGKGGVFCKPESSAQVGGDVTYVATYAYTERTGCSEL
jgi:hypothetical protein